MSILQGASRSMQAINLHIGSKINYYSFQFGARKYDKLKQLNLPS